MCGILPKESHGFVQPRHLNWGDPCDLPGGDPAIKRALGNLGKYGTINGI